MLKAAECSPRNGGCSRSSVWTTMPAANRTTAPIMDDIYDPQFVKGVFDRCSDRYITFSLICSLGFTERWRRQCVAAMPAPPAADANGYDLMAGTGEVWPH